MTTLLLVRHAETDAVGKSVSGWVPGWHLNAQGRQQAAELASALERLPIRAVYTSPLERAAETAEAVARKLGLGPEPCEELGELRFGEWEGLSIEELDRREDWRSFNTYRSGVRPPGGESMLEVQARMMRWLGCAVKRHADEMIAAVSHGDPLRAVVSYCLGAPLDLVHRFEIMPASVSVLEMGESEPPRLLCLNHLCANPGRLPL